MNNSSSSYGVVFAELLAIAFIVLKLCGIIHWSWVLVLSPLWISLIIVVIILVVIAIKELRW